MVCRTADMRVQTSPAISSCARSGSNSVKGPIVRNPLEQWPAKSEPGGIALPPHYGGGAHRRSPSPARIDEQRVADLAHEILAAAIRLAAMLEVAQRIASAQGKGTAEMAVAGGPGHA
jgi:hypothetical protein